MAPACEGGLTFGFSFHIPCFSGRRWASMALRHGLHVEELELVILIDDAWP